MDEVERLIAAFGSRGKQNQSTWKLDVLMDLAGLGGPRVASFLRAVLTDGEEPGDVRVDALQRLRAAPLAPDERVGVAESCLRVLGRLRAPHDLRLYAALVLGDFVDVPGVLEALGALAAAGGEPLDLRYNAFTALQRAGSTAECRALLEALRGDETLGPSARGVLEAWGAA